MWCIRRFEQYDANTCPPWMTPSYMLGLVFIVLVAIIWAAASVLVQFLYTNDRFDFHSPFLLTYMGVSLFCILLPIQMLDDICHDQKNNNNDTSNNNTNTKYSHLSQDFSNSSNRDDSDNVELEHCATLHLSNKRPYRDDDDDNLDDVDGFQHFETSNNNPSMNGYTLQSSTLNDNRTATTSGFVADNCNNNNDETVPAEPDTDHHHHVTPRLWTQTDHIWAALHIAPVWFLANWTYNASLAYTSITSSTVLASTGAVWTFLLAVVAHDEHFTWFKCAGVVMGMLGSLVTTYQDGQHQHNSTSTSSSIGGSGGNTTNDHGFMNMTIADQSWFMDPNVGGVINDAALSDPSEWGMVMGDILGLVSAIGYGAYAVQTRILCPHNETLYSMKTMLGWIGVINMIALSPVAIYLVYFGGQSLNHPAMSISWTVIGCLVMKGLFDNVLSDYLWLRAVILTNATVATVGLGLTIPLAVLSDVVLMGEGTQVLNINSMMGAVIVLIGFVLVNMGNSEQDQVVVVDVVESTTTAVETTATPRSTSTALNRLENALVASP